MDDHDDLAAGLAELVDESAPTVTLDEVKARAVPGRSAGHRRRRQLVGGVVVVALLGAVALIATVVSSGNRHGITTATTPGASTSTTGTAVTTTTDVTDTLIKAPPNAIHRYDLPPGVQISQVVAAQGSVWLAGYESACTSSCSSLFRLDPRTHKVVRIDGAGFASGLGAAYGEGALWVLSDRPDGSPYQVSRVDLPSGDVRFTVAVPDTHVLGNTNPTGRIAVGLGAVWVYEGNDYVARLDPQTGRQVARIELPPDTAANGLAVNAQGVWVVGFGVSRVARIDPGTNTATVVADFGPGFAQSIAASSDAVWTTHFGKTLELARIDAARPHGLSSTGIPTPLVAANDRNVWFLGWEPDAQASSPRNHYGLVGEVDRLTLGVGRTAELPISEADEVTLTVTDGAAWVVDSTTHTAWSIDAA